MSRMAAEILPSLLHKEAISYDVEKAHICTEGIEPYVWPVSRSELVDLRDKMLDATRKLILENLQPGTSTAWDALHITYNEILREILVLLRSKLSYERVAESHSMDVSAADFKYFEAFRKQDSVVPTALARLTYASQGLQPTAKYLRPLRQVKFLFDQSGFRRQSLKNIPRGDIVTFSTSVFMQRHAGHVQASGHRISLCSLWEWYDFPSFEIPRFDPQSAPMNAAEKMFLDVICATIRGAGYDLSRDIEKAIEYFVKTINFYAYYLSNHLLASERRSLLPAHLWFGSTNNLYQRTLRAMVQKVGGRTYAHDHGQGMTMAHNAGNYGTIFDFCDEFFVYSSFLAQQAMAFQEKNGILPLSKTPLKFTGVDNCLILPMDIAAYRQKPIQMPPRTSQRKRMMFLSPVFKGEQFAGLNALPADVTFADFQIRLLCHMRDLGFDVFLKEHPESRIRIPDQTLAALKIEKVSGFVEDGPPNIDLVCFDFLSSPLKTLIMTDIPLMYFDFGLGYMAPEVAGMFEKRIEVVKGRYSPENRSEIDWDKLPAAIQAATSKRQDKGLLQKGFGCLAA